MTLYQDLGVRRNASATVIKTAYYRRARATHPDQGGSAEAFRQVNLAYKILSDPKRRAAYDRDGAITEDAPDEALSEMMGVLAQVFDHVARNAINSERYNLAEFDVLAAMRESLAKEHGRIAAIIAKNEAAIAMMDKIAARFTVADGENRMAAMLRTEMAKHSGALAQPRIKLGQVAAALAELDRYRYQIDQPGLWTPPKHAAAEPWKRVGLSIDDIVRRWTQNPGESR